MSPQVLTRAIHPASDRPVYKQIADHLREAIGKGRLKGDATQDAMGGARWLSVACRADPVLP